MCTVTFIPDRENRYILTSSRDEQTSRSLSSGPLIEKFADYNLLFPYDPKGGGTWIATDNNGKTVCLFNGAFKAHIPTYSYKYSRGIIVKDFFRFGSTNSFMEDYDLENIEPFTLIIINHGSIEEFKWDGDKKYLIQHTYKEPRIWSSVTLYSSDIIKLRESWFYEWATRYTNPSQSDIISFHLSAGNGNKENDILMERPALSLCTVSITSVLISENKTIMKYLDLLNGSTIVKELLHN
jgi:hypothetical protein